MRGFWKTGLLMVAAIVLGCGQASAERRVALVIGNGAYAHKPELANPRNDADDVAAALKRINFEVMLAINLGQADMQDAIIRFSRSARNADVALFYYSGHAMQHNGVNYLMPVDAKLDDEADLKRFARVDDIMYDLQQAKNLKILVLDSCRDNPFTENLKRSPGSARGLSFRQGLSKVDAPLGTIVSFSTQAGRTADDGDGRNSPYSAAFLRRIEEPKEIGEVFRDISADVYETSGKAQLPELSLSLVGKYYLKGSAAAAGTAAAPTDSPEACSAAESHWKSAEAIGTIAAFEDHVSRFPGCAFTGLAQARIEGARQKTALAPSGDGPASAKTGNTKFDGEWDLNVSCPAFGKASSYFRFMKAEVKDGVLHGEYLTPGTPAWFVIDGKIAADGKASFVAKGLTGNPAVTMNNSKPGSPYTFTADGQFEGSSGSGKRNELRPCDLKFAKR